jgi:hypothetical protein
MENVPKVKQKRRKIVGPEKKKKVEMQSNQILKDLCERNTLGSGTSE